ncbi:cell division protein SepF [Hoyosella sp. YIM 151337]|uniref:cell division protein SepF n=1 Tax=Hoyosella sp. YIM 151337 TaxID=2992742 RepID=UPI002235A14C|nr:cell division protein SepF [Hoyosella sp. YIM 151337]MCW4355432.1 cell division protein SepF [Hoyosella sp. YIM 151337]
MSTLQKIKEYFALVPPAEYEDDYLDEPEQARGRGRRDDDMPGYRPGTYVPPRRDDYPRGGFEREGFERDGFDREAFDRDGFERDRFGDPRSPRMQSAAPVAEDFGRASARQAMPRRAERIDAPVERRSAAFEDGGALGKITTLRPRDYSEARTVGEQFRDGVPVIMDLNDMPGADAKRLVDFAAGCAFALNGSFEKVASKVFLLSPADIDVSAEDRRRLAENGLYQAR